MNNIKITNGSSAEDLAKSISDNLGVERIPTSISKFDDSEIKVSVDGDVKGANVFLIHRLGRPTSENILELFILLDAIKRGLPNHVTVVAPYTPYSRQDRKDSAGSPISAKLFADLVKTAGAQRYITIDLHVAQAEGFFDIPVEQVLMDKLFIDIIKVEYNPRDIVIAAADVGAIKRAHYLAAKLNKEVAVIEKKRVNDKLSESLRVLGDVTDKEVILVDDIIASGGTVTQAAEVLLEAGAKNIDAVVTHGVFNDVSADKLTESSLRKLYVSDSLVYTIPEKLKDKVVVVNCADTLSSVIEKLC